MTLSAGTRVGPFEILSPLGAGGMGEVYRARDSKLGRDVAIKVLPAALAGSSERHARLQREAKLLASLNHPNIAGIYGLEESDGGCALVMELVEGLTLQGRLAERPLSLPEALMIAKQIAEALEYAHEHGIVHRDLKPGNVKLTPRGSVKVLDFGLAKALAEESLSPDQPSSPTVTSDSTGVGIILGTAAYMSPEQAQGKAVDRRTDIWSFGVVLYEMLTGKRLFAGATGAETLAQVITKEPDLGRLPATTPPSLRRLLRRCLEKDQTKRLHDIGDARLEIEEAEKERIAGSDVAATVGRRPWLWAGALISAAALALVATLPLRTSPSGSTKVRRLTLAPPLEVKLPGPYNRSQHLALSPDGTRVVFKGFVAGEGRLYVQSTDDIEARAIPGTEGSQNPFFSPDGAWVAFGQGGQLRKLWLGHGEAAITIADIPGEGSLRGASWGPDGTIVFSPGANGWLWQVPSAGGTPRALTRREGADGGASHRWPQVLPDGRHVIFAIVEFDSRASRLALLSLDTGKWHDLVRGTGYGRYSPSGHLVYAQLGTLFSIPFDISLGQTSGSASPVLDDVQMNYDGHMYADFEISASGSLVYAPGFLRPRARSLLSVDREGRTQPVSRARRAYWEPHVSPDGRQLVATVVTSPGVVDLWRLDFEKDAWSRLTFGGGDSPVWSADGRWLAFQKDGYLMRMPSDGGAPAERLWGHLPLFPDSWSAERREIVFSAQRPGTGWDIGVLSLETREPRWLVSTEHDECCGVLSPDGRFLAYFSDESGRSDLYVRPYSGPGGEKLLVSSQGGTEPVWSRDGRELYYRSIGDRHKLMAVSVEARGRFRAGAPRSLFDDVFAGGASNYATAYDVLPDGRFVFVEELPPAPASNRMVLIPDWKRELEGKLHAAKLPSKATSSVP